MSLSVNSLASGALEFTLALAWNEAVSKTIKSFFPPDDEKKAEAKATIIYALIVTILIFFAIKFVQQTRKLVNQSLETQSENIMDIINDKSKNSVVELNESQKALLQLDTED